MSVILLVIYVIFSESSQVSGSCWKISLRNFQSSMIPTFQGATWVPTYDPGSGKFPTFVETKVVHENRDVMRCWWKKSCYLPVIYESFCGKMGYSEPLTISQKYFLFEMVNFHCHVILPEDTWRYQQFTVFCWFLYILRLDQTTVSTFARRGNK